MYLEILDRFGRVRERQRLQGDLIYVGRAYNNDIILDDHYVSPRHLRLAFVEGSWHVEDLQSANGLYLAPEWKRVENLSVGVDVRIRVGHTVLRFRAHDHQVEEALVDPMAPGSWGGQLCRLPALLLIVVFSISFMLTKEYAETYTYTTFGKLVIAVFPWFVGSLIWAGGWALATRIVSHQFCYAAHLNVVLLAMVALEMLDIATDYLVFVFRVNQLGYWLTIILTIAILTIGLYRHLYICILSKPRRLVWVAFLLSSAFVGNSMLSDYVDQSEFSSTLVLEEVLGPPSLLPGTGTEREAVFSAFKGLQAVVDADIEE